MKALDKRSTFILFSQNYFFVSSKIKIRRGKYLWHFFAIFLQKDLDMILILIAEAKIARAHVDIMIH